MSHISHYTILSSTKISHKSGKEDAYSVTSSWNYWQTSDNYSFFMELFINWTSCPVKYYTFVTRCYNCQQYGHSTKDCWHTNPTFEPELLLCDPYRFSKLVTNNKSSYNIILQNILLSCSIHCNFDDILTLLVNLM